MSNVQTLLCHDGEEAYIGDTVRVDYIADPCIGNSSDRLSSVGKILRIGEDGFELKPELGTIYKCVLKYHSVSDVWLVSRGDNTEPEHVDHPSHYQSETGIECIDAIESATFNLTGVEAFDVGNTLKYLWRWKNKNGLEDLKKAQWYLTHLINHVEKLEKENN